MLNHDYVGPEHILLGLLRKGDGVAAQVLVQLGADLNRVRQQVIQLGHGTRAPSPPRGEARLANITGWTGRDSPPNASPHYVADSFG